MPHYFQRIFQRKGIKNRLQVVVPILPLAQNMEAKVDFAIGKKNHLKEFKKCDGWCIEEVFFIWGKAVKMFQNPFNLFRRRGF